MRGRGTQTPRNRLEALRNIDNKTPLNIRRIDPITGFVQDLEAADGVLGEKCKETDGIFMGSYTLGTGGGLWVFDEFHAGHVADEGVECGWGEGKGFSD